MTQAVLLGLAMGAGALTFALVISGEPGRTRIAEFAQSGAGASRVAAVEPAALYLVRATLMTLDDANRTGDYRVLRLVGGTAFRSAHSPESLADAFAPHRASGLDLSLAALAEPTFDVAPTVGSDRLLRLVGGYAQGEDRLQFALTFVAEGGAWRLLELHAGLKPASPRIADAAIIR